MKSQLEPSAVIPMSRFPEVARLVKNSSLYEVYDLSLARLVVSMTVLWEGKSTTGHMHEDSEEVYIFVEGTAEIQLGDRGKEEVTSGDIVVVPPGVFHRVFNNGGYVVRMICVFEKYDGRGQ